MKEGRAVDKSGHREEWNGKKWKRNERIQTCELTTIDNELREQIRNFLLQKCI